MNLSNRSYAIRACWHLVNAQVGRPSRRLIQAALKLNFGVSFNDHEVADWLKANQAKDETGKLYLLVESNIRLAPVGHQVGTDLAPKAKKKANSRKGKIDRVAPAWHQVGTPRADLRNGVGNISISGTNVPVVAERDDPPVDNFDESDWPYVAEMLDVLRLENATGRLTPNRIKRERRTMFELREQYGAEIWRYGMREAINRGTGVNYAKAVMANPATAAKVAAKPRGHLVAFPGGLSEKPLHSAKANERFVKIQEELEAKSRERIAEIEKRLAKDLPPTADQSQ